MPLHPPWRCTGRASHIAYGGGAEKVILEHYEK